MSDPTISHVLIFKRDRYSRPEDAVEALQTEKKLLHAGITLVFSDKIVTPVQRGKRDLAQDIGALLEYNESGAFCEHLAERMILTHKSLAAEGFSTGGNPPYGHVRALFGPDGTFSQILEKGRTIRQEGFHVRWIPGHDEENRSKIRVWVYLLSLSNGGWGGKRIAHHLNALGIPSPGAGSMRTDNGVTHVVTGKWSPSTVLDLIRNSAIAGEKTYGARAEGKHRRLGDGGWRYLNELDRRSDDEPKVTLNPDHLIVRAPSGAAPSFDSQQLAEIQRKLRDRGRTQRGIPRKDPAKYPLSGRVIDLSDGCGAIMYGATQSGRPLYKCGLYMRTAGSECNNNAVDAEALLRHLLETMLNSASELLVRTDLEAELLKIAHAELSCSALSSCTDLTNIDFKLRLLTDEVTLIESNLARAKDQKSYDRIDAQLKKVENEILRLQAERQRLVSSRTARRALALRLPSLKWEKP